MNENISVLEKTEEIIKPEQDTATAPEDNELYVEFKKPFAFEEKKYNGLDMSALENMTGAQLCVIHKRFDNLGIASVIKEQNADFACIAASTVLGMPIEFFKALPAVELNKIKNKVFTLFYAGD